MDGEAAMTTEVQIRKSRTHLPYLRKIVARVAATLGMNRTNVQETEEAVNEICFRSIEAADGNPESSLSIRFDTHEDYMTVEITDHYTGFDPTLSGHGIAGEESERGRERVFDLADKVEFIRGDEQTTIRITKYARALARDSAPSVGQSPTSTLHA